MAEAISRTGKVIRGAFLAGVAAVAWLTISSGFAMAEYDVDPVLLSRVAGYNAFVQASLAESYLQVDLPRAQAAARRALARDPSRASAAGALGLALTQKGDMRGGLALLDYSERISRRELQVQFWNIELAAERGDIAGALHHYDIALRIGSNTPKVLFPVMARAVSDPLIREPLAQMLAIDIPWKSSFFDYLGPRSPDVVSAAQLVDAVYRRGGEVPPLPLNVILQRLMDANRPDLAWTLYAHGNPRVNRAMVRNGSFEDGVPFPSLFDWQLENRGDAWAQVVPNGRGNGLEISAQSGSGGVVAHQRLLLAPGNYRIAFTAKAREDASLGDSAIRLTCVSSSRELFKVPLAAASNNGDGQALFAVPANCPSQSLELNLASGKIEEAIDGIIDNIVVTPQT